MYKIINDTVNNEKVIVMEKDRDTYKICITSIFLTLYINKNYKGCIRINKCNLYEWILGEIQQWVDYKEDMKNHPTEDTESLF